MQTNGNRMFRSTCYVDVFTSAKVVIWRSWSMMVCMSSDVHKWDGDATCNKERHCTEAIEVDRLRLQFVDKKQCSFGVTV